MHCQNCGNKLEEVVNFCTSCGAKVNVSVPNNVRRIRPRKMKRDRSFLESRKTTKVLTILLFSLIVFALIYYLWSETEYLNSIKTTISSAIETVENKQEENDESISTGIDYKPRTVEEAVLDSYISDEDMDDFAKEYRPAAINGMITDMVSYKVISEYDNYVILEITAPDMKAILKNIASSDATFDDVAEEMTRIEDFVTQALMSDNLQFVTNIVEVEFVEHNDYFEIIPNDEYVNAVYGGMISYYNELTAMEE